jgi:hypothetical protein
MQQTAPLGQRRPIRHRPALAASRRMPPARAGDAADQHPARPQTVPALAMRRWPHHPLPARRPHQLAHGGHTSTLSLNALCSKEPAHHPGRVVLYRRSATRLAVEVGEVGIGPVDGAAAVAAGNDEVIPPKRCGRRRGWCSRRRTSADRHPGVPASFRACMSLLAFQFTADQLMHLLGQLGVLFEQLFEQFRVLQGMVCFLAGDLVGALL